MKIELIKDLVTTHENTGIASIEKWLPYAAGDVESAYKGNLKILGFAVTSGSIKCRMLDGSIETHDFECVESNDECQANNRKEEMAPSILIESDTVITSGTPSSLQIQGVPAGSVSAGASLTLSLEADVARTNFAWRVNGAAQSTGPRLDLNSLAAGTYNIEADYTEGDLGTPEVRTQVSLPDWALPAAGALPPLMQWQTMPGAPNMEIMRVTNAISAGDFEFHHAYSRKTAFTSDGKYYLLNDHVMSMHTGISFRAVPLTRGWAASRTDPDVLYGFQSNIFGAYSIANDTFTAKYTAPSAGSHTIGAAEGSVNHDDTRVALTIGGTTNPTVVVINPQTGVVIGTRDFSTITEFAGQDTDWIETSASGNYVVVLRKGSPNTAWRLPADLSGTPVKLAGNITNHSDVCFAADGVTDQLVEIGYPEADLINVTANSASKMPIHASGYSNSNRHVSGEAIQIPGYVMGSDSQSNSQVNYGYIAEPNQNQVEFWGWSFSTAATYQSQAKTTVAPDKSMIMFATDWAGSGNFYEMIARQKPSNLSATKTATATIVVS